MKLTVLIDNNTLIDQYFLGEPGVSYYIEDESMRVLFDTGYSDAFIQNAKRLKLDLLQTDFIVLSHGHLDHTWGLDPLAEMFTSAKKESRPCKRPKLVAHPDVFNKRTEKQLGEIGCRISREKLEEHFDLVLKEKPYLLSDKLVFLGEIERTNDFENKQPCGVVCTDNGIEKDFLPDDSALAYKSDDGLVIITGCSHSGICNIIEYARKICDLNKVADVIGGFHLMPETNDQLAGTLEYFRNLKPASLHACHCVDLKSKIALSTVANIQEVGVGMTFDYC